MEKWINCKNCGHEFSSKLSKCPECGKMHLTVRATVSALCVIVLVLISGVGIVLGFTEDRNAIPTSQGTDNAKELSSDKENSSKSEEKEAASSQSSSSSKKENGSSSVASKTTSSKTKATSSKETTSSQTATSSESDVSSETVVAEQKNYNTGLTIGNGVRYVTVPKYYLDYMYLIAKQGDTDLSFDDFAYSLNTDRKVKGVSRVIKNPNGAATYTYSFEKYTTAVQDMILALIKVSTSLEKYDYVESVDYNQHFDNYDIKLTVEDLENEEQAQILSIGLAALEYQYFRRDSRNEVTINLTFKNGKTETVNIDETIQQAMVEYS